jgi:hypothetical protein
MKVICKYNDPSQFFDKNLLEKLEKSFNFKSKIYELEIEKIYTVYGIKFYDNLPMYYICAFEELKHPYPYPAAFFNIVEENLSKFWRLSIDYSENNTSLLFNEWAIDPYFYEKLVDGDKKENIIFNVYKERMNEE